MQRQIFASSELEFKELQPNGQIGKKEKILPLKKTDNAHIEIEEKAVDMSEPIVVEKINEGFDVTKSKFTIYDNKIVAISGNEWRELEPNGKISKKGEIAPTNTQETDQMAIDEQLVEETESDNELDTEPEVSFYQLSP